MYAKMPIRIDVVKAFIHELDSGVKDWWNGVI